MIPLRVLGDRVLVALEPKQTQVESSTGMNYREEQRTAGGIILAAPTEHVDVEVQTRGIVVALGKRSDAVSVSEVLGALVDAEQYDCWDYEKTIQRVRGLLPAPFDVQIGDCVLFPAKAGDVIPYDGVDYVLLPESEILAVLEPMNETAEVV